MTIAEIITQVDSLRRNTYEQKEKISWLSQLDQRVKSRIIDTHEGGVAATFTGYDEDTDEGTVLLVPAPYDEMYLHYLIAQIEYFDQQEGRYNNANRLFESVWNDYACWYNRTHMPIGPRLRF